MSTKNNNNDHYHSSAETVEHGENTSVDESFLNSLVEAYAVSQQPPTDSTAGGMLVGEILDTHHPHRAGRVLVRWSGTDGANHEHWLARASHIRADIGLRVLIIRPLNWPEWVIVSSLTGAPETSVKAEGDPDQQQQQTLKLESGETLKIESSTGKPLVEVSHHERGAVLRLGRDLNLELPGTFRVQAERIEMCSGQSGTDSRSDGEMVCRSPRIRLN